MSFDKELQFSLTIKRKKNFYINQAAILRSCRAVTGYTQREAAKKLDVSASTLCGWEQRGCRDLLHCSRLAELYHQDLSILLPSSYKIMNKL